MKKFRILIFQLSSIIIVFCILTFIKFIFPDIFDYITELYKMYFCVETDVNLVLGGL